MSSGPDTIRIVIPLAIHRRNGRAHILPPAEHEQAVEMRSDPRMLRAIAQAWSWRRKLGRGDAATLRDIAQAENISDRFVSRLLRLAYLSPEVLEQLLIHRRPSALSINALASAAAAPWAVQPGVVFEE